MLDVKKTIISQYQNSPTLNSLIVEMNERIDPRATIESFVNDVMNIHTCTDWGLDNWGRIIGLSRTLNIPLEDSEPQFGFRSPLEVQPWFGFNQAPFRINTNNTLELDNETYRALLLVKAAANISNCSASSILSVLESIFNKSTGDIAVINISPMVIRFVFKFELTTIERELLTNIILPRPAGVMYDIFAYNPLTTFGFYEDTRAYAGFNVGTFYY